jgi:Spy/CpxP family protein refolding chaperone
MRRSLFRLAAPALLGLVLPLSVLAQDAPAAARPGHDHHLRECLSILDLSDQQKTDIQGLVEAARPAVEANRAAVQAARQTLRAAVDAVPPDACTIGNDFLAVRAAVATLRGTLEGVRDQIMAVLTPDQQARLQGCLDAPRDDAPTTDATPQ